MFIRPNWRTPEAYKFLLEEIHTPANVAMAWEFLRRNFEYQADCKAYLSEVYEWCFNHPKHLQETYGFLNQTCRLGTMLVCFDETCGGRNEYWQSYFNEKWAVPSNVLPGDSDALDFFLSQDCYPELFKPVLFEVVGPHVLIPVDLSMPLDVLLRMVEGQVREFRSAGIKNGTVKPRTSRVLASRVYIEHLRILDAVADGATVREIVDVLTPGASNDPESRQQDKRIKAAHKAALKMQKDGYRALISDL